MRLPRSLQILSAAIGFAIAWWRWHKRTPERLPPILRAKVERLGTTFIKLAQGLSLRWDLLPRAYREALGQLQSRVAPFPTDQSVLAIESAFGRPVDQLFSKFDRTPMAAASVAQIHRAEMPDGRQVVVKVRRPGIVDQVRRDLRLLRLVVRWTGWLVPALRRQQPMSLIDELGDLFWRSGKWLYVGGRSRTHYPCAFGS
jgi:ubiquinone biosynthesis protein